MNSETLTGDYRETWQALRFPLKLSYGIGHVLNDICASMWFTYLLIFFHLVLGFTPILAGVLMLIGQIADALATPFVGYYSDQSDNIWFCKYGRRKIWHLLGTTCVIFTFPFIFSYCIGCETAHEWAQLIYFAAFVVIFQFGWAAVQVSHLSLIPELTPNESERTELIAIRYSFTVISNVFVYCITWAVLHITNDKDSNSQIGPDDISKFQKIIYIGISVGIVTSILFHIFVKENVANTSDGSSLRNSRSIPALLKNSLLYQVACVYMPSRLFGNLSQIYIPLYMHQSLSMPATSLAIVPLIMFLSSFVMSLLIEKLNTKLGRKISYSFGVVLAVCACIWIQFGEDLSYVKYQIYPVSLILGSAGSILLVTSLGITSDFIGQNIHNGALVYGIMSFTDKLCNGLVVMLIQYLSSWFNPKSYYKDVLVYSCSISAVFGLLVTLFMKPFQESSVYRQLQSEQGADQVNETVNRAEVDNTQVAVLE